MPRDRLLPRVRRTGITLAAALGLLGSTACRREPVPARNDDRHNVLLIVVDTLRADKLGCYGHDGGMTPHTDALAAQGVLFEQAFAHAPWTLPSFASLLTSTYPVEHDAGGRVGRFRPLSPSARTLAECFRDAGYATGAVVNVDFLSASFGMNQGYADEDYDFEPTPDNLRMRGAEATTDAALAWIRRRGDERFFMMVHYFDPHLVYDPPMDFRRRFADPRDREDRNWVYGTRADVSALRNGEVTPDAETIGRAEKLYDAEVAYTDQEIGRLIAQADALGLGDSTVVAVTADHGEEFLDHGGFEHGHTLYAELLHVPLILRYPGGPAQHRIAAAVGQVAVAPTLCELAGVEPEPRFAGRSLLPLIDGSETTGRPILSQGNFWGPLRFAWQADGYKLIRDRSTIELYHLATDPAEQRNVADAEPGQRDVMRSDLDLALKSALARQTETRPAQPSDALQLTPAEIDRLRSLGYLK
jgi:arylsulfatase A-like enzyme